MRTRILTAGALLPIVAAVYLGPPWLFLAMATVSGLVVTWEATRIVEARGHRPLWPAAAASIVLVNLAFHAPRHLPVSAALASSVALVVGWFLLTRTDIDDALECVSATLAAVLLPGFLLAFQVALRGLGDSETPAWSAPSLLLFLYAAVFGSDAAAYFVGRAFGRLKLAPIVSPGKTVEGFFGGIVAGAALGTGVAVALRMGLPAATAALWAALLAVAGVFGGMAVSLLKRSGGVKDTGHLLPGHGGLLDRLDGLLFSSPLLYLLVTRGPSGWQG